MPLLSRAPSRHVVLVLDDRPDSTCARFQEALVGAEVMRCTSEAALCSALGSGRRYSAVVADRVGDEVARLAADSGAPVVTVDRAESAAEVRAAVEAVAVAIPRGDWPLDLTPAAWTGPHEGHHRPGRLVTVCGPGGTGASSVAAATASLLAASWQGSAAAASISDNTPPLAAVVSAPSVVHPKCFGGPNGGPPPPCSTAPPKVGGPNGGPPPPAGSTAPPTVGRPNGGPPPPAGSTAPPTVSGPNGGPLPPACSTAPPTVGRPAAGGTRRRVLLADLALHGDQAFLHGLIEPSTGLLDLVEAARYRLITAADVRRHTVGLGGIRLLPGLRKACHWTALSPRASDAALSALVGAFDVVVADVTGDFEGETDSGSWDVEERNQLARSSACGADVVIAVGGPGPNGARRLAQIVDDLLDLGVDPSRMQPVVNRSEPGYLGDRHARVCGLPEGPIALPQLPVPPGELLPPSSVEVVVTAVLGLLARLPPVDHAPRLVPVAPGSLGCLAP